MLQCESYQVPIMELDGVGGVFLKGNIVYVFGMHVVECDLNWVRFCQSIKCLCSGWVGFRSRVSVFIVGSNKDTSVV